MTTPGVLSTKIRRFLVLALKPIIGMKDYHVFGIYNIFLPCIYEPSFSCFCFVETSSFCKFKIWIHCLSKKIKESHHYSTNEFTII